MNRLDFDALPTAALFDKAGAVFAMGDGSVRFEDGARTDPHAGAILCAAVAVMRDALRGGDGRLALAALVRVAQRVSPQDANEVIRSLVITKVLSQAAAVRLRDAAGLSHAGGIR